MRALITGITGQDGSYLAESLLEKGYKVFGLVPRRAKNNYANISRIKEDITLLSGDVTDFVSIFEAIKKAEPVEIYNLAAQSFVGVSWTSPVLTTEVNAIGPVNILEAIKTFNKSIKFYQASTSEMFGNSYPNFCPCSPYGISKLYAHHIIDVYRKSYDIFAVSGILFNHDSPRRGEQFFNQKMAKAAVLAWRGKLEAKVKVGNLLPCRDIGHAKDYVEAMWLMLQNSTPTDYEVASGKTYSCADIAAKCFDLVGLNYLDYIVQDAEFYRPLELNILKGNPEKIKEDLNWEPTYTLTTILEEMVSSQLAYL